MNTLAVTVVWATATAQDVIAVTLAAGATVADALRHSGVVEAYALDAEVLGFAIAGRRARLSTTLADGDRIDITRALTADPKEIRRLRARATPLPPAAKPPRARTRRRRATMNCDLP